MGLSRAERAATDIVLRHRQGTSRNHRRSRPRFSDANLRVTTRSVYFCYKIEVAIAAHIFTGPLINARTTNGISPALGAVRLF